MYYDHYYKLDFLPNQKQGYEEYFAGFFLY